MQIHQIAVAAGALCLLVSPLSAQWTKTATLQPSVNQDGAQFGFAVACSPDLIAVGAPNYDLRREDEGAVGEFKRNGEGWRQTSVYRDLWTLATTRAHLGRRVDVDGSYVIAGAFGHRVNRGMARGFENGSYASFFPRDPIDENPYDHFGWDVVVDGDVAVVAAKGDDEGGTDAGAIYIYEAPFYKRGQKITGTISRNIGASVDVDGGRVIAASLGQNILVYEDLGGWTATALLGDTSPLEENFGISIAISGDVIVVGTESEPDANGHVYVYDLSISMSLPVAELESPDGANGDFFGIAVDVHDDWIIVGAPLYDVRRNTDGGAAYLYQRVGNDWIYRQRVLPGTSPAARGAHFGAAVAIDNCIAVVGAPYGGLNDRGFAVVLECQ